MHSILLDRSSNEFLILKGLWCWAVWFAEIFHYFWAGVKWIWIWLQIKQKNSGLTTIKSLVLPASNLGMVIFIVNPGIQKSEQR